MGGKQSKGDEVQSFLNEVKTEKDLKSGLRKYGYSYNFDFSTEDDKVARTIRNKLLNDTKAAEELLVLDDIEQLILDKNVTDESGVVVKYYVRVPYEHSAYVNVKNKYARIVSKAKMAELLETGKSAAQAGVALGQATANVAVIPALEEECRKGNKDACDTLRAMKAVQAVKDEYGRVRMVSTGGDSLSYVEGSGESIAAAQEVYRGAAEFYAARDAVSGGGSANDSMREFIGGDELDMAIIKEYEGTLNSFTKQKLVADLVTTLKQLGFSVNESADYNAQVAELLKALPNSKTNGKSFGANAEKHAKVCKSIAMAVNASLGKQVVDPNAAAPVVCQAVSELVSGLSTGMHVEFMVVHDNVRKILKNLYLLKEQLDLVFSPIATGIDNSSDARLKARVAKHQGLYKLLTAELTRQIDLLKNLLSVTLNPAEARLKNIIKEGHELSGLIEKISYKPGESQFGELISKILNNVGMTAEYALVVDQALKTVGLSVKEYAGSPNLRALVTKVSDTLLNKNMNDEELYNFLQSAELLYKNYYRASDIEKLLQRSGAGADSDSTNTTENTDTETNIAGNQSPMLGSNEFEGASESFLDVYNSLDGSTAGGADESEFRKTSLDRRIENKKEMKTLVFTTFARAVDEHMSRVIRSLDMLAGKVGTGIKLSDELDGFRNALSKLRPLLMKRDAYQNLLGYYSDAQSKERRDTFIGQLNLIKSYSDSLGAMAMYASAAPYFQEVSGAIAALKSTVEQFSDKIAAKFGGDDKQCLTLEAPKAAASAAPAADSDSESEGAEAPAATGGAGPVASAYGRNYPSEWKPSKSGPLRVVPRNLTEIIRKFDYMYKVAQIKENLTQTGKEIDHYSENYENIRGESVAKKIDNIREECSKKLKFLSFKSDEKSVLGTNYEDIKKHYDPEHASAKTSPATGFGDVKARQALISATAKAVEEHCRVRMNFWRTVEAVDEYMRVFTNDVAKNPGSLQEIKSMLDETDIIASWYTAKTGHLIHSLFDSFPTGFDANKKPQEVDPTMFSINDSSKHYYEKFDNTTGTAGKMPGNVYLVLEANDTDEGFKGFSQMKKITRNLSLLKNILSVFVHVGSTFGDKSVYKKVFMTPTQIYKNLSEWIEICSFGVGASTYDAAVTPVANTSASGAAANHIDHFRGLFGIYMRKTGQAANSNEMNPADMKEEDEYFALIIKSMCAKVLTVVGMYDLMERPDEVLSYNQVRYMIGGAETPAVESRAVELYVRLPLLAEFYRDLFNFDSLNTTNDFVQNTNRTTLSEKIAMLPEVEGTFSGLIKLVFQKAKNFKLQEFSDSELKELIAEVNLIWNRMAGAGDENAVSNIIRAFVNEINMRYGIISQRERNAYLREFGYQSPYMRTTDPAEDREVDVPLLPGEEDIEFERDAVAPSKKFEIAGADASLSKKQSPYFVSEHHRTLVRRLRCALDSYFHKNSGPDAWKNVAADRVNNPAAGSYGVGEAYPVMERRSLLPVIKVAKIRLQSEQNSEQRFRIVSSMIHGSSLLSRSDYIKHAMFHETVVAGLNVLSCVYTILSRYQLLVLATDTKTLEGLDAMTAAARAALVINDVRTQLRNKYYAADVGANTYNPFIMAFKADYATANTGAMHVVLNLKNIALDLLEGIMGVSKDLQGLVEVTVDGERVTVNFSRLKECCLKHMENIRSYVELLRGSVSNDLITRYTDKQRVGSLYWLQEQLIEKLFEGRAKFADAGGVIQGTKVEYVNLDSLNVKLNSTLKYLRGQAETNWGNVFARISHYDNVLNNSGINGTESTQNSDPTQNIDISQQMFKLMMLNRGAKQEIYPQYYNRFTQLYQFGEDNYTPNTSLLFGFNQLVAKYLELCFDKSTEKIYTNNISHFVNGVVNSNIMNWQTKSYADYISGASQCLVGGNAKNDTATVDELPVVQNNAAIVHDRFRSRTDPKPDHILFTSLALMFKNLLTSKNATNQTMIYLLDNFAEVSVFKKEELRAHLPTFRSLFKSLQTKAELFKQLMNADHQYGRTVGATISNLIGLSTDIGSNPVIVTNVTQKEKELANFQSIATNISTACSNILTSIDSVLRELADSPKYLELYSGFMQEYRANNETDPLMPLSTSLYCLNNYETAGKPLGMPFSNVGSNEFRLAYGTRGLLGSLHTAVTPASVPGWSQLVDMYNSLVPQREQVDGKQASGFLDSFTQLLRYSHNVRNLKGNLAVVHTNNFDSVGGGNNQPIDSHWGSLSRTAFVDAGVVDYFGAGAAARRTGNRFPFGIMTHASATNDQSPSNNAPAYPFKNGVSALIDLTLNGDKNKQLEKLASSIATDPQHNRESLAIANILDMNIMPINVHALMRDIPLANLYNYSYTFERLLVELFYGINDDFANLIIWRMCQAEDRNDWTSPAILDRLTVLAANATVQGINAGVGTACGAYTRNPTTNNAMELYKQLIANDGNVAGVAGNVPGGVAYAGTAYSTVYADLKDVVKNTPGFIKSAKELFVALMVDPYRVVNDTEYYLFGRICKGDSGIPLGRPKFISDQLYNKVLLNELYESGQWSEAGPRHPDRAARVNADSLRYQKDINGRESASEFLPESSALNTKALGANAKGALIALGQQRFNTVFIRNLVFMTNAYRSLNYRLRHDLMYNKSVIVNSNAVTREDNTEFVADQRQSRRIDEQRYEATHGRNL